MNGSATRLELYNILAESCKFEVQLLSPEYPLSARPRSTTRVVQLNVLCLSSCVSCMQGLQKVNPSPEIGWSGCPRDQSNRNSEPEAPSSEMLLRARLLETLQVFPLCLSQAKAGFSSTPKRPTAREPALACWSGCSTWLAPLAFPFWPVKPEGQKLLLERNPQDF